VKTAHSPDEAPPRHCARAGLRKRVGVRARVREAGPIRYDVTLIDLSAYGFRGETFHHLRAGTPMWITLPGLSAIEAEVVWQRHEYFGCRFRQPLHPAVFDHIVETVGQG
jgi:hypothetical protein